MSSGVYASVSVALGWIGTNTRAATQLGLKYFCHSFTFAPSLLAKLATTEMASPDARKGHTCSSRESTTVPVTDFMAKMRSAGTKEGKEEEEEDR